MTILYANPYNIDANGFQFSSAEEFTQKAAALRDRFGNPVEEFEIDYLDGDEGQLFRACGVNQCNLATWFDEVELLDQAEKAQLFYLTSVNGYNLADALEKYDNVALFDGPLIDAASQLFDDAYLSEIPEAVRPYVDYEAFARDCQLSGDMYEMRFDGSTWTITNASGV